MKWVSRNIDVFVLAPVVQANLSNATEYEMKREKKLKYVMRSNILLVKCTELRLTRITKSGIYFKKSKINTLSIVACSLF